MLYISASSANAFSAVMFSTEKLLDFNSNSYITLCTELHHIYECDRRFLWTKQCNSKTAAALALHFFFKYTRQKMKCPNLCSLVSVYRTCPLVVLRISEVLCIYVQRSSRPKVCKH